MMNREPKSPQDSLAHTGVPLLRLREPTCLSIRALSDKQGGGHNRTPILRRTHPSIPHHLQEQILRPTEKWPQLFGAPGTRVQDTKLGMEGERPNTHANRGQTA